MFVYAGRRKNVDRSRVTRKSRERPNLIYRLNYTLVFFEYIELVYRFSFFFCVFKNMFYKTTQMLAVYRIECSKHFIRTCFENSEFFFFSVLKISYSKKKKKNYYNSPGLFFSNYFNLLCEFKIVKLVYQILNLT